MYNLGNKDPVTVTYMIECLERAIGKKAIKMLGFSTVFDPFFDGFLMVFGGFSMVSVLSDSRSLFRGTMCLCRPQGTC